MFRCSHAAMFSCVVAVAVGASLLATSRMLAMAWDEGNAIDRAAGIRDWAGDVRDRGWAAFSQTEISRCWHYTVEVEGHPALYGILIAFGQWLGKSWLEPLSAARLGPMLLFSAAAGAMFYRLRRQYSLAAALSAVAALVTMPRLFAHAHFASFDGPLTSCWILAWATFTPTAERGTGRGNLSQVVPPSPQPRVPACGCEGRGRSGTQGSAPPKDGNAAPRSRFGLVCNVPRLRVGLVWGVALGATMSCKFTGWLAPAPFIAYALVYGDRTTAKYLAIGIAAALATFWLVNPRLWHHPIDGMQRFFDLNLNRAGTKFDIPTMFFGQRYDMQSPLPWYNTLVWTAITVPTPLLLLAGVGIVSTLRRWAVDGNGTLILANWLVLLVARALPGTPVHDAERLILPSFGFLAALAGVGCHALMAWAQHKQTVRPGRLRAALTALTLMYLGSASSLVWYAPQWLSYYNVLTGGLRGADAAGMEATYYWDALDGEVLDWLHANTREGERIEFNRPSSENLTLMQHWGVLRRGWRLQDPGQYRWYVVQRRTTFWTPADRWLIEHEKPAFAKTIRPPGRGFGPWRLDVPLIEIYSNEQYLRAQQNGTSRR